MGNGVSLVEPRAKPFGWFNVHSVRLTNRPTQPVAPLWKPRRRRLPRGSAMASSEVKKPRRDLSVKEKLAILHSVDSGKKKKDVATAFNIPRNTLSTILKQREKLNKELCQGTTSRKRIRLSPYEEIEAALLEWIKSARSQNIPLSGAILKRKAADFAFLFDKKEFKASDGWLARFKNRHALVHHGVCGESAAVNPETVSNWQETFIPDILKDYKPKDVFNADESGLFFKMLPDKTLSFKNEKCHGGKRSKERITVMFNANMDGSEKEKLLVIGKSKHPRCFKGMHILPVNYDANKKAWMTTEIFLQWLKKFDRKMAAQERKVLLLLDNCASHKVPDNLDAVEVMFFPPNCTSVLQPMDQGIIQNVKSFYRKRLVQRTLINYELKQDPTISLRNALEMLYGSWNDVQQTTIAGCFRHAGFTPIDGTHDDQLAPVAAVRGPTSDAGAGWDLLASQLHLDITFQQYVDIDDGLQISHELTDSDEAIVEAVKSINESTENKSDSSDDEETTEPSTLKTSAEAFACLEDLKRYIQATRDAPTSVQEHLDAVQNYVAASAIQSMKQKKITNFFLRS